MTTLRTALRCLAIVALFVALQPATPAGADDGRPRNGFYVGGHVGYLFGNANATLGDPIGGAASGGSSPYGAPFAGLQAGYEHFLAPRLMLGMELDMSFPDYQDLSPVLSYRATGTGTANEELEWLASLRGRLGYAMGSWTPFVTGGIAWASTRFSRTDLTTGNEDGNPSNVRAGYVLGGGVDYRLDSRWSARAEYLYTNLGLAGFIFNSAPARYDSQYDLHRFQVGLNYKFGDVDDEKEEPDKRGPGTWEIHGQTVFVFQGYAPFSAPYDGPNSLPAGGQSRQTWGMSAFLGVRLWQGGELYYNPELLQGYGVALTTGAGGFPNGDALRAFPYPRYNTFRLFLRQTFGLGGERETVESDFGQLAGERDVSRITLQAGKFAVQDMFNNNIYAGDPRVDFLNWSIWTGAAFDAPEDSLGFSWGVVAELNRPSWAVRAGYFLVGDEPLSNDFDLALPSRGGYVGELEMRFRPYNRPGALRVGVWLNSIYSGSYNDAVALAAVTPGLPATNAIVQTRQGRTKYGSYLSLEQQLSDDVGAFLRFSWNDGRTEISGFTDVDTSLALGVSIRGASWGRPEDVVGIGGALNAISSDHANYLAAGGLGVTVGDGALSYASENVIETYYAFQLAKGVTLTADYQFLANPAYNIVRGPAHFFSGRLMARF